MPVSDVEEYLSVGEYGRPCIQLRKLRTNNSIEREKETMDEREDKEKRGEEKGKAQEDRNVQTGGLIREYQKHT